MSRIFGEIRQNGYVVRDIDSAMAHWSQVLGVGPWFYAEQVPITDFFYRGEPFVGSADVLTTRSMEVRRCSV